MRVVSLDCGADDGDIGILLADAVDRGDHHDVDI